ncbi:MAG: DUF4367 domain-containing protein [Eubacteriaceae bacterium]|jgi:hypothetical protein|nr:DUF4367 domain-containing protein [Eubacteriaceae bacterium]
MKQNNISGSLYEKMQSGAEKYAQQASDIPKPDLAFMYAYSGSRYKLKRFKKAAVIILCIIAISIPSFTWMHSDSAYGGKRIAVRIHSMLIGSTLYESPDSDSYTEVITVSKEQDIHLAERLVSTVPAIQYVPAGYKFKSLTVQKSQDESYCGFYDYKNAGGKSFKVNFSLLKSGSDKKINGDRIDSSLTGRHLYYSYNEVDKSTTISFVEKGICYDISGEVPQKTLIKIAADIKTKN